MANFAKNHWGKIVLITSAVVLAGLIAAPFIWNATKTVEFLKDSVKYIQSLIEKTGLSNVALGGILAGMIAAIGVMTLIAMYIAGRKLPKGVEDAITEAADSSLIIEDDKITINYNKVDLETTETSEGQITALQASFNSNFSALIPLLKKNISEKVEAQDAVNEVKNITTGAVTTSAQAAVKAKEAVSCTHIILDMGNVKWTDKNAHIANKLYNQIYNQIYSKDPDSKALVIQFKNGYKNRNGDNKYSFSGIIFKAPDPATTRTVKVTLSENKAVDNRNMANKVHDGINTCINMTVLKCVADDKKLKMVQDVTVV